MQTKQLGNSDLHITPVGVGAWAMGGAGWEYAWSSQDDNDSIAAIHRALDLGVNWIDTAAVYGLGHSEEVVARAVKGMTNKPYIFTKCSLVWGADRTIYSSLKADSVRREVEDSLRRLQIEQIDLYQIHWPDPEPEIEEGWQTLVELQQAGKIRHIAVSNFSADQMRRAMSIAPITSNQPPYSAVRRGVEESVLPFCLQNNIGVIVYSPMQAGILTGKMTRERVESLPADDWRKHDAEYQEPRLSKNLRVADVMVEIAKRHNVPVPNVSIAWVLHHPAVTGAIVGVRNPKQADEVIGGGTLKLTDEDMRQIDEAYLG
ncbi:MAG: aldo/keto reductase [Anaerolineae bacterium]|jgi:aryl-alcohol dehydrogenase-like predicted oxidoreductase|nr:aldo/keto reductase [Anaerolineae bacterium]